MENRPDKDLGQLALLLFGCYNLIREILAALPLPIEIAEAGDDDDWDPEVGIRALDRIRREVIPDLPLSPRQRGVLVSMILEWLTGYEVAVAAAEHDPTAWRLDGIEYSIKKTLNLAKKVARELSLDVDVPGGEE